MNLVFVVFRLIILLSNSMSELIHKRCTCKVITKTAAAYVYANEQLRLCFYFLTCSPWNSPLKIMLKLFFPSGSVNNAQLAYNFIN